MSHIYVGCLAGILIVGIAFDNIVAIGIIIAVVASIIIAVVAAMIIAIVAGITIAVLVIGFLVKKQGDLGTSRRG